MGSGLAKRVAGGVLSLVLGIVILTIKGCLGGGGSAPKPTSSFPVKFLAGGTPVTIEVELSEPGDIHCTFASGNGYDVNKPQYLRVEKALPAGKHTFVVSVPKQTEVEPEVHIRPPHLKRGSKITLVMRRGAEELQRDEVAFDADALKPNEAFFAQLNIENAGG
jgi:hypothetical protein